MDTWLTKSNYSEEVPYCDEVKCCYVDDEDVQAVVVMPMLAVQ